MSTYARLFLLGIIITSFLYGCTTINESMEQTDKTLKGVESKGSDVVNSVFGEGQQNSK
ncbi:MAG: hypothetical protein V1893_03475 [Candidatus Omnitrophota bacterium]